jgi:hypothetical protein
MTDMPDEPEYLEPNEYMDMTLKQLHRAIHNRAAINGELPSIIDSLVDDE